jgi:hypothetical protein
LVDWVTPPGRYAAVKTFQPFGAPDVQFSKLGLGIWAINAPLIKVNKTMVSFLMSF